jgi:hypothetical protein
VRPFPPRLPPGVASHCSVASQVLWPQTSSLLQPYCRLIGRHAKDESLGFFGEIRPTGSCYDHAELAAQPQSQGQDRNVIVAKGIFYRPRPFRRLLCQPLAKCTSYFLRSCRQFLCAYLQHLDWCVARGGSESRVDEIQAQHAEQRVNLGPDDMRWVTTARDCGRSDKTRQIIDAALKALALVGDRVGRRVHINSRSFGDARSRRNSSGGIKIGYASAQLLEKLTKCRACPCAKHRIRILVSRRHA